MDHTGTELLVSDRSLVPVDSRFSWTPIRWCPIFQRIRAVVLIVEDEMMFQHARRRRALERCRPHHRPLHTNRMPQLLRRRRIRCNMIGGDAYTNLLRC